MCSLVLFGCQYGAFERILGCTVTAVRKWSGLGYSFGRALDGCHRSLAHVSAMLVCMDMQESSTAVKYSTAAQL